MSSDHFGASGGADVDRPINDVASVRAWAHVSYGGFDDHADVGVLHDIVTWLAMSHGAREEVFWILADKDPGRKRCRGLDPGIILELRDLDPASLLLWRAKIWRGHCHIQPHLFGGHVGLRHHGHVLCLSIGHHGHVCLVAHIHEGAAILIGAPHGGDEEE